MRNSKIDKKNSSKSSSANEFIIVFLCCLVQSIAVTSTDFSLSFFLLAAVRIRYKTFQFSHFFSLPFPHLTTTEFRCTRRSANISFHSFARLALRLHQQAASSGHHVKDSLFSFHFVKFTIITINENFACYSRCFFELHIFVVVIFRLHLHIAEIQIENSHTIAETRCVSLPFQRFCNLCTHFYFFFSDFICSFTKFVEG